MFTNKYSIRSRVMEAIKELINRSQLLLEEEIKVLEARFEADKEASVQKYVDKIIGNLTN